MSSVAVSHDRRGAVLADLLPGARVRDAALVGGYAGAIGVSAQLAFPLPGTPVPVTGQTLAVLGGALVLGRTRAVLGALLYLTAGAAGVPWFAPGSTASFGYIIGFVVAAGLLGAVARRGADRRVPSLVGSMLLGNAVIYLFGVTYLAAALGVGAVDAIRLGMVPFLLGDTLKIVVVAGVLPRVWRRLGWASTGDGASSDATSK